jgi:primosomal protein N' (replication factor Y) (superfamily II helicase)
VPRSAPDVEAQDGALRIARVAVEGAPFHLGDALDYLVGESDGPAPQVGHRVELSLAGRRTRGLIVDLTASSQVSRSRLRPIGRLLGDVPWTDETGVELLRWAAQRFGAPLADVVRHAFPGRVIDEERRATAAGWWPPRSEDAHRAAVSRTHAEETVDWTAYGAAGPELRAASASGSGSFLLQPLPGDDVGVLVADLAETCIASGRDVLLIVPDPVSAVAELVIGKAHRLLEGSTDVVVDLRGGPTPRMAYRGWLQARAGRARLVVGERGAAFMPLARLGLAVVLDEPSPVHKEQRSPRHHVREVALERARRCGGVGLLTADVPSAVARSLVVTGRLRVVAPLPQLRLARRPVVRLETGELDARARISRAAMRLLRDAVERGGYGVVLAARRGEGRALVCSRCRDLVRCTTCSAAIARATSGGWWCPSCGSTSQRPPRCERCGPGPLSPLAAGAERLGEELRRSFSVPVAVLEGHAPPVPAAPAVLVMTRGSVLDHPPAGAPVQGVVLPDMEGALRRPVLDAAEDALRLAFRLAGWTVRTDAAGDSGLHPHSERQRPDAPQVVVEVREPDHHAFAALVDWDQEAFWVAESALRLPLQLPPHRPAIRIETTDDPALLARIREHLAPADDVIGPLPIARGRVALLIRSAGRDATLTALRPLRESASRDGVDLRIDVDPVDLG